MLCGEEEGGRDKWLTVLGLKSGCVQVTPYLVPAARRCVGQVPAKSTYDEACDHQQTSAPTRGGYHYEAELSVGRGRGRGDG